jgi:sugar-specific transcriptional regulator TrmB
MKLEELKVLGLTNGEIKVYTAILNIGISTVNKIHERTGLERRAIYDIINKLIEKGLISYTVERGKRTYQCAPPNKLKEEVGKRIDQLQSFEKLIPDIEKIYQISKPEINVEIFRGKEGIKAVFEDILNYKEARFIGGGWYVIKEMPYYWPKYNKRRIELGIKFYNLIRFEVRKSKLPKDKLTFMKFLPKEFSGAPNVIFIYGNKVVNVLWGEHFFALMTEGKEIADNYRLYHKYLWDKIAKSL